jgi:magnesium transporter
VQSTQEIVELVLDSNRNALLALDLKVGISDSNLNIYPMLTYSQVSIGTMGIGTGALVAGLFGMNVRPLRSMIIL